jgi:branched-chain amino acid transport system permease protein
MGMRLIGLFEDVPVRALTLLVAFLAVLLSVPFWVSPYLLSVLVMACITAYLGQVWNILMGFAGQLSLGHSLYVGLGAYVSAVLFVRFGITPWIGALAGMMVAAAFGAAVGFLAFRFGIGGVYFALLTIAFAEFTRVGFDHITMVGGSAGLFLPVADGNVNDLSHLRGSTTLFYYLALALAVFAFLCCRALLGSRIGYYWMAIREDQDAAKSLGINVFRLKILAIMVSAALTALGGMFIAFYSNILFPEQIFSESRSIEIVLAPLVGGLGTLFGPVLGAFVLTGLAEGLRGATQAAGVELPGTTQMFYGVALLLVVKFLPGGIWPVLYRRLGIAERPPAKV